VDSPDASTWSNISAPITWTGFETEVDISAADRSSLVWAKVVDRDGNKLGWTDAADGNGNYFWPLIWTIRKPAYPMQLPLQPVSVHHRH
jgi:hypothetical protein